MRGFFAKKKFYSFRANGAQWDCGISTAQDDVKGLILRNEENENVANQFHC